MIWDTYSTLIKENRLVGRGWTTELLFSQEPSEPVSPQGVRVGARVLGLFRTDAILNTWAHRGWIRNQISGELFSRFFFLFSLSDFGEFSATRFLFAVGFLCSRMAGHCLGISIYRNPEPYHNYPIIVIRIGFDFQGGDKILFYPFPFKFKDKILSYRIEFLETLSTIEL